MYCIKCHKELPDGSLFCPDCGAKSSYTDYSKHGETGLPSKKSSTHNPDSAGLGIASMVCGICSIVFFYTVFLGIILSIVGLVLGRNSNRYQNKGAGMAKAGIITSIVGLSLGLLYLFLIILGLSLMAIFK